jgi:dUTPase
MSQLPNEGPRRSDRISSQAARSHSPSPLTTTQIQHSNDNDNQPLTTPPPPNNLTPLIEDEDNDNDLSYHSTQASDDPPFQSITTSNNQTFPHSSSTNPNQQLHHLLTQLTSRIDTIELHSTNRIDSLEQQILQSQTLFQQQLIQSQQSLATIIKESIQPKQSNINPPTTYKNTNNTQATTHPIITTNRSTHPSSVPTTTNPPSNNLINHASTTSCDPPTTTHTFAPPTNIIKPTSPDPPESTYNIPPLRHSNHFNTPSHQAHHSSKQISNQLHHKHTHPPSPPSHIPPISEQNQYTTSTPTFTPSPSHPSHFHPLPPPAPNPSIPTPTIIVQAPTQTPKLLLDSYKKDNGYLHFKHMSLLSLSADPYYSDCVQYDKDGNLQFNPHMSDQLSKFLFCATIKALGRNASEVISTTTNRDANAFKLWAQLDSHFLRSTSSHILKNKLKKEFDSMKKESNESFSSYVSKFESCLQQLRHNNIDPGTSSDIAYRFIESLALPKVFNTILMNMDEDSSWALGGDLRALMYKAENHYQKYEQIYASSSCPRPSSPSPPPRIRPQRPSPTPSPAPSPQPRPPHIRPQASPPTSVPRPPSPFIRNEPEIQRIRALLQASPNPTSTLHHLHHSQPHSCSLHSNGPHPIISCAILRNICNQTGHFDVLNNTRNDLNLPPMPSTGLLALPPRHRTQPPPSSTRVANPYLPTGPPPTAARHVYDDIDEINPLPSPLDDAMEHFDDTNIQLCPLTSPPPGFDNSEVQPPLDNNFSNHPIDPYLHTSFPCSILNPPHVVPRKRVRFLLPPPLDSTISCRYIPSSPPPFTALTSSTTSIIRAVCDSGASHTMTSHLNLFDTITYFNPDTPLPTVVMGDDSTKLPITGYGYIHFKVHNRTIRLFSYLVPTLGTTLLSIKQHMRTQGCYFHAEAKCTVLAFPSFQLFPRVSSEIDLLLSPIPGPPPSYDFDEQQHRPIHATQPSRPCRLNNNTSTATLSLLSPHVSKYISQPKLQAPFAHTVHFHCILPTATLPTPVKSNRGGFSATTITPRTILPGSSASLPTGLHIDLPDHVILHTTAHPSFSRHGLSIIDTPTSSSQDKELHIRICNTSMHPVTIPSNCPIAQYTFTHNSASLVPLSRPSTNVPVTSSPSPPSSSPTTFHTSDHHLIVTTGSQSKRYRVRRASRPSPSRQLIHPSAPRHLDPALLPNSHITPISNALQMHNPPIDPNKHISPSPSLTTPRSTLPSDSVNAALPKVITMTRQCLLQSIGFRQPDHLLKHMRSLSSTPVRLQRDSSPQLDAGETATMHSSRRNTTPSSPPSSYSDVWHLDIGYGPCSAIGGIRYTLLAVDKSTRYKFIYGLKNLKSSLLQAIQQFVLDCGVPPKLIRTDFDHKIMGGPVANFLRCQNIPIQASPPYRQHQNGLVESHWQTVVSMARS